MLGAVAAGVTATSSDQASAAEPSSIDFTATCVFLGQGADQDYTLVGTVDPGPVAPGGEIHITDLVLHDLFPAEYYWMTIGGTEVEIGAMTPTPPNTSESAGTPASSQPLDVTLTAPSTVGPYAITVDALRVAPGGYDPEDPGGGFLLDCTVTDGDDVLAVVDVAEPTTTTTSTTTTTTSTTTTVPEPVDETVIDADAIVSEGCQVTVPIHFADTGAYTVTAVTEDERQLGSTDVTVDEPGDQDVVVTIDGDHGTQHGDPVSFVLTDADGTVIDQADGQVDDPDACTPDTDPDDQNPGNGDGDDGNGDNRPLVSTPSSTTPPAATPVSGNPTYTG